MYTEIGKLVPSLRQEEKEIGSIEIGKRADLISVSMNQVEVWPLQNILSHLVYAAGRDQ